MSNNYHQGVLGVLLCLLLGSHSVDAQRPSQILQAAKSLTCEFPLNAMGTWTKAGEPQGEIKPAKLSLEFHAIDVQDGTADVTGGFGAPHIVVQFVAGYLHFMQIANTGSLYVTTVFDKETRSGKLKAVHARHEYTEVILPGFTARPEQYYGECAVGQ